MALVNCKECNEEMSTKAGKCPHCGAPGKKKTSVFTLLVVIVLGLWFVGSLSESPIGTASNVGPSPKTIALNNTKLDFTWTKIGFDNIMEANFTITNSSEYPIKDIEIVCTHFANSGTRIDSNERTIYEIVPAQSSRVFEKFNMGFMHAQAETTSCRITDLVI